MQDSPDPQRKQEVVPQAPEEIATPSGRLERIEAAVKLIADDLQTTSTAAQVIEAEQARRLLTAVALGISATSVLALLSLAAIFPVLSADLLGLALAMSLIFLGSVLDLLAWSFFRTAINIAIQNRDFSDIALRSGPGFHLFQPRYWAKLRRTSPDLFFHHVVRYSSIAIYIIGILYIIRVLVPFYTR